MYRYTYNTKGQLIGSTELTRTGTDTNGQPIYDDLVQSAYWYDDKDRIDMVQHNLTYALSSGESMDVVFYGYTYNDSGAETLSEFNVWGVGGAMADYTYTYDELYRLTNKKLFIDGGYYQDVAYTYRNQNTSTTTGQIGQSVSKVGNATDGVLSQTTYTYEYDTNGNITKITDSDGNVTRYTYDDLGQLTREDNPYLNKSYTYTYDKAGNRTSKKTYAYTTSTLGTVTDTQTLTYKTDSTWGDQLANNTYDAVGNPLTYNGNTMTWNGRQLMRIYGYAGMVDYSFTYNDEGIRTSKNINGTVYNYTLDGSTILSQQWGNHLMVFLYDESGSPIGLQYRSTSYAEGVFDTYYYEKNVFGDIIGIYTEDGTYIGGYTYDAWGTIKTNEVTSATTLQRQIVRNYNPFRYRGYYYDTNSSLYYLQSRYYDPATGRFINVDSALYNSMLGYNMYLYCNNNPVNYYDPAGESAEAVATGWGATMWWLTLVDGSIPIGDILYVGGCIVAGVLVVAGATVVADEIADVIPETPTNIDDADDAAESDEENKKVTGRSLPVKGEPNSDVELYDEDGLKQRRHYGPDGRAEYDIDYRHQDSHNNHKFPHRHDFDWSKPNPRGKEIDIFP